MLFAVGKSTPRLTAMVTARTAAMLRMNAGGMIRKPQTSNVNYSARYYLNAGNLVRVKLIGTKLIMSAARTLIWTSWIIAWT